MFCISLYKPGLDLFLYGLIVVPTVGTCRYRIGMSSSPTRLLIIFSIRSAPVSPSSSSVFMGREKSSGSNVASFTARWRGCGDVGVVGVVEIWAWFMRKRGLVAEG